MYYVYKKPLSADELVYVFARVHVLLSYALGNFKSMRPIFAGVL